MIHGLAPHVVNGDPDGGFVMTERSTAVGPPRSYK